MQWHQYRTLDPGIAWLRDMLVKARIAMDQALLPLARAANIALLQD